MIISFSGVDGAGKSTQLALTKSYFQSRGYDIFTLHIISWSLSNKIGKAIGLGKPRQGSVHTKPNIGRKMSALAVGARHAVILLDCLRFRLFAHHQTRLRKRVLLCDRHFLDMIVQGLYQGYFSEFSERLLRPLAPGSTLAFLLDTTPTVAKEREGDHAIEYYCRKRKLYLSYANTWNYIVIGPGTIDEVYANIAARLSSQLDRLGDSPDDRIAKE